MADWIVDTGIGEHRAALIADGAIVEARIDRIERPLRLGTVIAARLGERIGAGAWVMTAEGDAILDAVPAGLSQGRTLVVEIVREPLPERGRPKPARARATDDPPRPAPTLAERLDARVAADAGVAIDAAGWAELIEQAADGEIAFPGGALRMSPTPAMTLFDVDGTLPLAALATAGARAAAEAIRRLDIGGSIGIDLPTLPRAERAGPAIAIDAALPAPFERTAVNGFGFVQIVRPRTRPSIVETVREDPALAAAIVLVRAAGREIGARRLVAPPAVSDRLAARPGWTAALAARIGGAVTLRADAALAISAGYVESV